MLARCPSEGRCTSVCFFSYPHFFFVVHKGTNKMLWMSELTSRVILCTWGVMWLSRPLAAYITACDIGRHPFAHQRAGGCYATWFSWWKKSTIITKCCYLLSHSIKSAWLSEGPLRKALGWEFMSADSETLANKTFCQSLSRRSFF